MVTTTFLPQVPATAVQDIAYSAAGAPAPSKENAARHAWRKFKKLKYGWTIPISSLVYPLDDCEEVLDVPYINPVDTVKYLMQHQPSVLIGGLVEERDRIQHLEALWTAYKDFHPQHPVYSEHAGNLSRVVPLCWHGDEGRGKKRGHTIAISIEAVIGIYTSWHIQTKKRPCINCGPSQTARGMFPPRANAAQTSLDELIQSQWTNMKGHSCLQRYPVFVLPGSLYKEHKGLVDVCLDQLGVIWSRVSTKASISQGVDPTLWPLLVPRGTWSGWPKQDILHEALNIWGEKMIWRCAMNVRLAHIIYPLKKYQSITHDGKTLSTTAGLGKCNRGSSKPPTTCNGRRLFFVETFFTYVKWGCTETSWGRQFYSCVLLGILVYKGRCPKNWNVLTRSSSYIVWQPVVPRVLEALRVPFSITRMHRLLGGRIPKGRTQCWWCNGYEYSVLAAPMIWSTHNTVKLSTWSIWLLGRVLTSSRSWTIMGCFWPLIVCWPFGRRYVLSFEVIQCWPGSATLTWVLGVAVSNQSYISYDTKSSSVTSSSLPTSISQTP